MNLFSVTDGAFIRMNTMLADLSVEETVKNAANGTHLEGATAIENKVEELSTSTYNMVFKVVMVGLLIGLIAAGAGLMFSDEQTRREKKSKIIWGVAGAAVPLLILLWQDGYAVLLLILGAIFIPVFLVMYYLHGSD